MSIELKVRRLRSSKLPLPAYQSQHAAGLDLIADPDGNAEVIIPPMKRAAIPTGIALEIPPGYEGQVRPRSGRAIDEGLTVVNAPGTIDADYRGEVRVLLVNLGDKPVTIKPGDRIAQLIIAPVTRVTIVEAKDLAETKRGPGGFGHTGR